MLASSTWALIGTLEHVLNRLLKIQKDNEVSDEELLSDIFSDDPDLIDEIEEDGEDEEDDGRARTPAAPRAIDSAKLQAEIELVRDFISRARSIGTDTKTRHLLTALKTGWDKLKELGAAEKAVVFTESRRSMNFLREYNISRRTVTRIRWCASRAADGKTKPRTGYTRNTRRLIPKTIRRSR